jgi:hypothetical protein
MNNPCPCSCAPIFQERVTSLESQSALSTQCFSQLFDLRHQLEASKAELLEQRKAYSAYMVRSILPVHFVSEPEYLF